MHTLRRPSAAGALLLAGICMFAPITSPAQAPAEGPRKVTTRIQPAIPELARRLNISGTVKVDAIVLANGQVKTVDIKGGHPALVQSASEAVRKWKWEPAAHETHELVEIKFTHNPD